MSISYTRMVQFYQHFSRFYCRRFAPLLTRSGLSMREMNVLLFFANNPDYDTARDVTQYRGLSKSQVSQAVDLLCAQGLLDRRADPSDRRVIHLHLTKEAGPLTREAQAVQAGCTARLLQGFSQEELDLFCAFLERVLDNGSALAKEANT